MGKAAEIEPFLDMLMAEKGASKNTIAAYRRDLEAVSAFLSARGMSIDKATSDDLTACLRDSARRLAPASQARRLSALRQYFRFQVSENRRVEDPTRLLDGPRLSRPLPTYLSVEEVEGLITAAETLDGPTGTRLRVMLELVYGAGLRVSELVGLRVSTISQDGMTLRITGKGGRERLVPLTDPARIALADYLPHRERFLAAGQRLQECPWLFPSKRGKDGTLSRQRFFQLIKDLAVKSGLDPAKLSPHTLRHAFATHLIEGGADLRSVQKMLGHADIATTQIYTHVTAKRLAEALQAHHPLAQPN